MGKDKFEQGVASEEIVHQICEKIFLSDFVVPNPKYKKSNKQEKEISDALVLFDDHLIGFQVKSKAETKTISEKNEADIGRIQKYIAKGISQLKSIKSAISENEQLIIKNKINIDITFNTKTVKKITGIVVLDLLGEENFAENDRTEILGGFEKHFDIPVHIFLRSDLNLIASEIDTPADFVEYLEAREKLYTKGILIPTVSERDFLAVYKLRPDYIKEALSGKIDGLAISEGHWDAYITKNDGLRNQRELLNKESYYVDRIISEIHKSIGFTSPELAEVIPRNDCNQGTVENYYACITVLSSLTRLERRSVGNVLIRGLHKADETGYSSAVYKSPNSNKGILILSTRRSRPERARSLLNLCSMAYCYFGLSEIIGIATENFSVTARSYDFSFFKDVKFENHDELVDFGRKAFGKGNRFNVNEYTGGTIEENQSNKKKSKHKRNKIGRNDLCKCGSGKKYKKCCLK